MMKKFLFYLFTIGFLFPQSLFSQWQMAEGLEGCRIESIVSVDSVIIAEIENRGIYKRIGNQDWELCIEGLYFRDILKAGNCVFVTNGSESGHYQRSLDFGETWETLPEMISWHQAICVDTVLFEKEGYYFMRSFDYGTSFDSIPFPVSQMWVDEMFANDSLFIASFEGQDDAFKIFVSDDYGDSWDSIPLDGIEYPYSFSVEQIDFLNGQYWLQSCSRSVPMNTKNLHVFDQGTQKWINVTLNLPGWTQHNDLFEFNGQILCSIDTYPVFAFNAQDSSWFEFADGSKSVNQFAMHQDSLYCATDQGLCSLDTNGIWTRHYGGISNRDITSIAQYHDTLFLTASNELFYSTDMGDNFTIMDDIWGKKIITSDSLFYMLSEHEFKISYDKGENWISYSDSLTDYFYAHLGDLCITPSWYYIGGNAGLYRSPTDSIIWTLMDIYPNAPTRILKVVSVDSSVFVGTTWIDNWILRISYDYGVSFDYQFDISGRITELDQIYYRLFDSIYFSKDLARTWQSMPFAEGYIPFNMDKNGDLIAVVGAKESGYHYPLDELMVLISVNEGQQWQHITHNLPLTPETRSFEELIIKFIDTRLFVENPGYGLWYRDDLLTNTTEKQFSDDNDFVKVYPNPAKDRCYFEYSLTNPSEVIIRIYNQYGRTVEVLREAQTSGLQNISWDVNKVAEGIYFFTVSHNYGWGSGKILVVK
jgi:Secretion system C-terminal sorting domain